MKRFLIIAVLTAFGFAAFQLGSASMLAPSPYRPAFRDKGEIDLASSAGENQQATITEQGKAEGNKLTQADEEYANRAYPLSEIPFDLTLNAQAGFNQIQGRGVGSSKNLTGQWSLIGPSTASDPAVLSFSGHDYTTSGRITALAVAPGCSNTNCRLWVAAAGGGIWRTDNALSGSGPNWTFVSGSFGTNAIGTLTYDAAHKTLYAGTGESHASADSESGLGIYKSTDGGTTWTQLPGSAGYGTGFFGRSISSIAVDPTNPAVLYVGVARGVRGVSSVASGGATSNPPAAIALGLYKSTDGGNTFSFIWNGAGSIRGVNRVALDPNNPAVVYAAAYQVGIWRSVNSGAFIQIKTPLNAALNIDRAEFAVTALPGGLTRMYVGVGNQGAPAARFYRTDDAAGAAIFADMTTPQVENYCTGQCWYDNYIVTPAGYPDIVYVGGSYQYGEYGYTSNSRAVLLSTDAGSTFTDMSWDASSTTAPNGLHPDQHALVVSDSNPFLFFSGSDGGLVRSSGDFSDQSAVCAARGLSGANLAFCQGLLSRIPKHLFTLNKGLSTLQFQSLSFNSSNPKNLMGGTQDNGTYEYGGSAVVWPQIIYGDGGQSGFSAANSALRVNTFTGQASDVNFNNGDPTKWVIATGPIMSSPEGAYFYPPITADPNPAVGKTIFQGSQSVWRTQDWGGDQAYLEANCPEFTTSAANPACGDFVRIGPAGNTDLTGAGYGADRRGGFVAAIERTPSDTSTLWVATGTGRVYISKNADAPASQVVFTRLDSLATNDPGRFVSSIYVDPANPNHAWISYSGYNFATPAQPGHVFEVTYDPAANTAIWASLDGGTGPLGDLPVTDLVRDTVTGDLYAATDFGVLRMPAGTTNWITAGTGMPMVEVSGLTIIPGARVLYAATHGRSAWMLSLP